MLNSSIRFEFEKYVVRPLAAEPERVLAGGLVDEENEQEVKYYVHFYVRNHHTNVPTHINTILWLKYDIFIYIYLPFFSK